MTPYFFKQMRKRTSLCLVVVLTALAFSLALCMLQRSRDQMAARIEEVYDNLEVRCSVTNLTGTQSDQLNLPDWVLRLFDGEKTYGNFQDNDLFAPYVRDVQVRSTVYCTTPGGQDRLTLSGVTGLKADSSLLASSGCTVIWREGFGEDMFRGRGFSLLLPEEQTAAKRVLTAAALTYVAALLMSVLQLLRFVLIFLGRGGGRRGGGRE